MSASSEWPSLDTGYHISVNQDVSLGTTHTQQRYLLGSMNSDQYVLVSLGFSLSSTGLVTQRDLNNSWIIFIGTLLGSVFGIMGSIATLMGIVEDLLKRLKCFKKYGETLRLIEQRKMINSSFYKSTSNIGISTEAITTKDTSKNPMDFTKIYPESFGIKSSHS